MKKKRDNDSQGPPQKRPKTSTEQMVCCFCGVEVSDMAWHVDSCQGLKDTFEEYLLISKAKEKYSNLNIQCKVVLQKNCETPEQREKLLKASLKKEKYLQIPIVCTLPSCSTEQSVSIRGIESYDKPVRVKVTDEKRPLQSRLTNDIIKLRIYLLENAPLKTIPAKKVNNAHHNPQPSTSQQKSPVKIIPELIRMPGTSNITNNVVQREKEQPETIEPAVVPEPLLKLPVISSVTTLAEPMPEPQNIPSQKPSASPSINNAQNLRITQPTVATVPTVPTVPAQNQNEMFIMTTTTNTRIVNETYTLPISISYQVPLETPSQQTFVSNCVPVIQQPTSSMPPMILVSQQQQQQPMFIATPSEVAQTPRMTQQPKDMPLLLSPVVNTPTIPNNCPQPSSSLMRMPEQAKTPTPPTSYIAGLVRKYPPSNNFLKKCLQEAKQPRQGHFIAPGRNESSQNHLVLRNDQNQRPMQQNPRPMQQNPRSMQQNQRPMQQYQYPSMQQQQLHHQQQLQHPQQLQHQKQLQHQQQLQHKQQSPHQQQLQQQQQHQRPNGALNLSQNFYRENTDIMNSNMAGPLTNHHRQNNFQHQPNNLQHSNLTHQSNNLQHSLTQQHVGLTPQHSNYHPQAHDNWFNPDSVQAHPVPKNDRMQQIKQIHQQRQSSQHLRVKSTNEINQSTPPPYPNQFRQFCNNVEQQTTNPNNTPPSPPITPCLDDKYKLVTQKYDDELQIFLVPNAGESEDIIDVSATEGYVREFVKNNILHPNFVDNFKKFCHTDVKINQVKMQIERLFDYIIPLEYHFLYK